MSLGMMEGPRKGEVVICLVVQELLKCWPIFFIDPVYQRLLHKTGQFNEFVGIGLVQQSVILVDFEYTKKAALKLLHVNFLMYCDLHSHTSLT